MFILYTVTGNMVHMLEKPNVGILNALETGLRRYIETLGKAFSFEPLQVLFDSGHSRVALKRGQLGGSLRNTSSHQMKVSPECRKCVPGTTRNPAHFPALHPDAMVL